jgi:pimeloyl-ACP methyl ester carboxylesterase
LGILTSSRRAGLPSHLESINDVKALAAYQRGGSRAFNSTDGEVAAIKVPVLGLIGSLDNVASMKQLQTLMTALKLVVIEGARHAARRLWQVRSLSPGASAIELRFNTQ